MKKLFRIFIFFVFLWKHNSFIALFHESAMYIKYWKFLVKTMTLHLLFMQEDEEFRSVPQVKPEMSVWLFLYEYQKRY